ncbi:MAG: alpha/beta hydrolase [Hyphomicrobium sp.]|nr:alpha/beta hydrolase [Hyphomicrobium sp.]PPD07022.1 MAG: alpha/beta hydrolase [Hyphomicrobium sp.]
MRGCIDQNGREPGPRRAGKTGVLLVHGLCGTPTELRFIANGLTRAGYEVACPTLAGHCGTHADLTATTWQDWYASAEAALLDLVSRCDRVIVGGLSTGAVLSLMLAARHPDKVAGLALYSPTLWLNGRRVPWYAGLFRLVRFRALASLFHFPAPLDFGIKDERLRSFIKSALAAPGVPALPIATPGIAALERQRLVEAVLPLIGRITAPVLMLHPREDDYADLSNASYLQETLGGPADLVVLEDSYHLVTVDRQRGVVLERTLTFLDDLTGTARVQQIAA